MSLRPIQLVFLRYVSRNAWRALAVAVVFFAATAGAQLTNSSPVASLTIAPAATLLSPVPAPVLGLSILRVFGALILVLAIFLGGVWLFRNWQRLAVQRGRAPKLNVLEVRSLGGRQALYVIGYERERFLLSSSSTGVNLVTHLPSAEESSLVVEEAQPTIAFSQVLAQVLRGGK